MKLVHYTQSAQKTQSKESNTCIVQSRRQSNAPNLLITTLVCDDIPALFLYL